MDIAIRQFCPFAYCYERNNIKSIVLFIKEYFYCYFVVKRRECISLDCIMSWELLGRFSSFNSTNGKMFKARLENVFLFFFLFYKISSVIVLVLSTPYN